MITALSCTSLDDPSLTPYRTLRQSVEHFRKGIFVAEGEKVVRRLLESPLNILSVLMTPEWLQQYNDLLTMRSETMKVFVGEKELLETIVGFNLHQGIMALGKIPAHANLDSVLPHSPFPRLFVALDGITNSENLGVLVRNCVAFGVQAILVGETSSSPYLRRAVRNSMGTVFKIPIVHCENLVQSLVLLRHAHNFTIVAAHPHGDNHSILHLNLTDNDCIVFGSEGEGISQQILSACELIVPIPMQSGVDSINVASASAVFLYEVMRQRNLE